MFAMTSRRRTSTIRSGRATGRTAFLVAIVSLTAFLASPAAANVGYEPAAADPFRELSGIQRGLAVDQSSQDIYVAIMTGNPATLSPGRILRFNSDLSADGVFADGAGYYSGVAVNPITHDFYGAQMKIDNEFGSFGTPRLDRFSPSGAPAGSFALTDAEAVPPIATDSAGRIYYPNGDAHSVQVFDAGGALQETITCAGCLGGSFGRPLSVALDSTDALYVVDETPDRVVKLTKSGGAYSFASVLQSGRGASAVGVDPSTDDVLVGDLPNGTAYHIVAYNSTGTQFDDFGSGIFRDPLPAGVGAPGGYQMAVNATTHELYVGEHEGFFIFERTTIPPPTATIKPASDIGQLTARLNGTVNANGHATLDCEFEYTESVDVGFTSATSLPCPEKPDGSADRALGVKVSGLSPDASYRYRVTATSNAGAATSSSATFATLPEMPATVTTEPPVAVTQTAATIKGRVNPHGGSAVDCHFDFGSSVSYGSSFPCPTLPGPATSDVAEARDLSGLTPGTAYHYRLVVTTNAGTTTGDDIAFTTASPPSAPAPEAPASPPETVTPPASTAPAPTRAPVASPRRRCRKGFRRRKVRGKVRCVRKRARRHHRRRR